MECSKIRELLSEYIDGALDPEQTKAVKDHLSLCERCSNEYASLKAVADSLDSLKPVKAPTDFLEKVHARINQRSRFRKVFNLLFMPAKIKIPLECAGVLATAVLIILLIKSHWMRGQVPYSPSPSVSWDVQEEEKYAESMPDERKEEPLQQQKIKAEHETPLDIRTKPDIRAKQERIELALLLKPVAPEMGDTPRPYMAQEEKKRFLGAARPSEKADELESADRDMQMAIRRDKAIPGLFDKGLSDITASIEKINGRYISTEYDPQTHQPISILADVPTKNYSAFLEELAQIGTLEGPRQQEKSARNGTIQVRIKLLEPQ